MTEVGLILKLGAAVVAYVAWKRLIRREVPRLRVIASAEGYEVSRDFATPPGMLDVDVAGFRAPLTLELAFHKAEERRESVATVLSRTERRFMRDVEVHHRPLFWASGLPIWFAECMVNARFRGAPAGVDPSAGISEPFEVAYSRSCESEPHDELFTDEVKELLQVSAFSNVCFKQDTLVILGWEIERGEIDLLPFIRACETFVSALMERGPHARRGLPEGVVYCYGGTKADYIARADEALLQARYAAAASYYALAEEKGPLSDEEDSDRRRALRRA